MINTKIACDNLEKYLNKDLRPLAEEHGITVVSKNGNINKGWKGLTIEKLAGLTNNNNKMPDGIGFELKTVSYYNNNNLWSPKETMAITMINPDNLKNEDFFSSHLWQKIKNMVFCALSWNGANNTVSKLLKISVANFSDTDKFVSKIVADYDSIRFKLKTEGFNALNGMDGNYIQVRTKGKGHGSKSKAFYAKKNFLERICSPFKEKI